MRFLLAFSLIALSLSCNPLKHYQKVVEDKDVTREKKAYLAPWIVKNFPPLVVYKKGKDSLIVDTLYDTEMIDSLEMVLDRLYKDTAKPAFNVDSLKRVLKKLCVPTVKTIFRIDTIYEQSPVNTAVFEQKLAVCDKESTALKTDISKLKEKLQEQSGSKGALLIWLLVTFFMALLFLFLAIKK
jgi:hypothetical protein